MPDQEKIFLSVEEVVESLRLDFEQYPSQLNLLISLVPLVFGENTYLMREPNRPKLWLKTADKKNPFVVDESEVRDRLVSKLKKTPPSIDRLAEICARVFQVPVKPAIDDNLSWPKGVWIETGMEGFTCNQCGQCCRRLDYRDGCRLDDYRRWQEAGRSDILQWVGTVRKNGQVTACMIWMVPGTNRFADRCPWLKQGDRPDRYVCTIHDVRPSICRQYPGSRKHARMTGCRGV